jgi:hypothetical protein
VLGRSLRLRLEGTASSTRALPSVVDPPDTESSGEVPIAPDHKLRLPLGGTSLIAPGVLLIQPNKQEGEEVLRASSPSFDVLGYSFFANLRPSVDPPTPFVSNR